jgi:hypothetical protein
VDWDCSQTYDIDMNDEDLVGDSLSYDQEKESVVDWSLQQFMTTSILTKRIY